MAATEQIIRERKRADSLMEEGVTMGAALRIARAELEREGRLVEALANLACASRHYTPNSLAVSDADAAVRKYEAEFAPPPRTVEQIMVDVSRNVVRVPQGPDKTLLSYTMVPTYLWDELAAALGKDGK